MRDALAQGNALAGSLDLSGLDDPPEVHGWSVDTSIERDHERFSGFLKLSLEEFFIALRDERELLCDPGHLFHKNGAQSEPSKAPQFRAPSPSSLYPSGFDIRRFIEVIEAGAVWEIETA